MNQKLSRGLSSLVEWMEYKRSKGFVKVLAIECGYCGRWVKPDDWHQNANVCRPCGWHLSKPTAPRLAVPWTP
ncbi:hypothetical protein Rhe02_98390 [Rhizocola hellebori]|uniref:Uncharacterized protein n=1 Tax=Rhizocola hellebori TaxID=1392758 RepID=A0A8J3VMK2_9ACTN|nr:hypothetical protein Rhe02_98390 [Rhizocola hellebori]